MIFHIPKTTKLLHYGLQRSGTNYLETLLKNNYRVRFLNKDGHRNSPLSKHFRLYDEKSIIPGPLYQNDFIIPDFASFEKLLKIAPHYYIIISKDPYSWLVSYENWAQKCRWSKVAHHYIAEYNLFYGKWLDFSRETDKIFFVRYIDLLIDPAKELGRLEKLLGLKEKWFRGWNRKMIRKVSQSRKFSDDRRDYYFKERYMQYYTKEELQIVNDVLDFNVVQRLSYKKIGG